MPHVLAFRQPARRNLTAAATIAVLAVLTGCTGPTDDTGLDAAAVADLPGTTELVAAVAADGVREDAARAAAVRVALDAVSFTAVVHERPEEAEQFMREVLDADSGALPVLVAAALDGLVGGVFGAAVDMATLDADAIDAIETRRFLVQAGAAHSDRVFYALRGAARESGIDDEARWAALLGVLDTARDTGFTDGSFVAGLDDSEIAGLTAAVDPSDLDDEDRTEIGTPALDDLLAAALASDPGVVEVITGDDFRPGTTAEVPVSFMLFSLSEGDSRNGLHAIVEFFDPLPA